ncbi:MAG: hypothetical protein ACO2O1_09190 [Candidatus Caldarchaeales archaeon]|jgi:hypothetical protein
MTSEEGLIIEDVDLVFVIAFDLGDKVNAKELGEAFAKSYAGVKAIWHPSEEGVPTSDVAVYIAAKKLGLIDSKMTLEEFIDSGLYNQLKDNIRVRDEVNSLHALFWSMIAKDSAALDPEYLKLGRYTRFKLAELEAEVVEPDKVEADYRMTQGRIREMVRGFRIEPYLLIHNAGIGVVTVWINLKGNFTTDDIITLEERLVEVKLNLKDALGIQQESITLDEFVSRMIARRLQAAVLFKDRYGDYIKVFEALYKGEIEMDKIRERLRERLRDEYPTRHVIVGVREVKCNDGCFTAEDVVKRHVKEVAGILTRLKGWRDYRIEVAEEDLGRNLASLKPSAMYLTIGASLFLGSPKLSKEIEDVSGSPLDKDTVFRLRMLSLATPVEFLALSDMILDVYDSFFRKKRKDFQERKGRGEVVNPSEYMELRNELTDALEEYRNVAFFNADPYRSILEYGKERYRLREWEGVLRSALDELAELVRTHYDERFAKSQLVLTVVFGIFGIFAAIEFFEKLVGLTGAAAVAAMTASALLCFYRWYMGNPSFRQFLLAVVIGANVFFGMIMISEKLIGLEREQAVVMVALMMTALFLTCYGQVIRSAQNYRV